MTQSFPEAMTLDPTVYPEEERVGENILQRWICELLRPLLQRWLTEKGVIGLVGADQFIYYEQHDAHQRIAPDIYLLPGVAPNTRFGAWKVWETGIAPSFALEIVSSDWQKDYFDTPERCDAAGVAELLVFDSQWAERPAAEGVQWQLFRRSAAKGRLVRVLHTDEDRVFSEVLGCWLRVVGTNADLRLRIGVGPEGATLVPTAWEAEAAERQAKEAERQAKEAERQAKEAERQAKEAALARVAELEAQLAARDTKPR